MPQNAAHAVTKAVAVILNLVSREAISASSFIAGSPTPHARAKVSQDALLLLRDSISALADDDELEVLALEIEGCLVVSVILNRGAMQKLVPVIGGQLLRLCSAQGRPRFHARTHERH